jgi:phage terminase large subunit
VLPADAKVHELGTGQTRRQVFHDLGCRTVLAPALSIHEGIDQTRRALSNAWFDEDECKMLIEALNSYRSAYDEVKGIASTKPVHDWSSHLADSMRYLAIGKPHQHGWGARPAFKGYGT